MEEIEIIKPDDWHVHFRDNEILKAVVPETTRHFARSIVMPNLVPPVLNGNQATEYKKRIIEAIPSKDNFEPLMTIYLTEETNKNELKSAYKNGDVFAAKLYPAGATTNSESGVRDIKKIMPVLETMAEIGMPLLIHGEVTDKEIDIFDREKIFINKVLDPLCRKLPELKITLEHITTKDAAIYVKQANHNLAATITPHHLILNRNDLLVGGIKPHNYCLPVVKRDTHRVFLSKLATQGDKKFFLGTDTAPHLTKDKESECGCAGIFNATYCIQILAEFFNHNKNLKNLEKFISINGANHYGLPLNKAKIKLSKKNITVKTKNFLSTLDGKIKIFEPPFPISWVVENL